MSNIQTSSTSYFTPVKETVESFPNTKKDAAAKNILSYREVLASILKYATQDFSRYSVAEIREMIEPNDNNPQLAKLIDVESSHSNLSTIEFDIKTSLAGPSCKCILNVEPQNVLEPSVKTEDGQYIRYSLAKRAMYYAARMITDQLGSGNNNYQQIKKCYTIWLLFNPKNNMPEVITFKPQGLNNSNSPLAQKYEKDFDLFEAIFIVADPKDQVNTDIQNLLKALFFNKSDVLKEYITIDQAIYKEVDSMCDMREVYKEVYKDIGLEEGRKEGREEGRKEGREEGRKEGQEKGQEAAYLTCATNLLKNQLSEFEVVETLMTLFDLTQEKAQNILNLAKNT